MKMLNGSNCWVVLGFFYLVLVCLVSISGEALQAGDEKRKYLERELLFYKSSARELKKKLKQTGTDVSQFAGGREKPQNTQPTTSEQDLLVEM